MSGFTNQIRLRYRKLLLLRAPRRRRSGRRHLKFWIHPQNPDDIYRVYEQHFAQAVVER
jgi:hypothetical protein